MRRLLDPDVLRRTSSSCVMGQRHDVWKALLLEAVTAMAYPLDADGVGCEVSPSCNRGGPALFLDRDGVVVEEVDYLHRVEDIAVCATAAAVISAANANAVPVVLVTNQAGIGRGYYGWAEFRAVQEAIQSALAPEGAHFDAV